MNVAEYRLAARVALDQPREHLGILMDAPRQSQQQPSPRLEEHRSHGQSFVELALVLPMLLVMTLGVFEFGRLIYTVTCVSHAARDGARIAMNRSVSDAAVRQRVIDSAEPITIATDDIAISSRAPGQAFTVTVSYGFSSPIPLVNELWGGGEFEISRTRTARGLDS
jgi:hypothetical protein